MIYLYVYTNHIWRFQHPLLKIYILDTNLEIPNPQDLACGEVGVKQLNDLKSELAIEKESDEYRILMMHHHQLE